jgi:phospholipid/cholesterol/gamma-HCH transport system ATP-binding protein
MTHHDSDVMVRMKDVRKTFGTNVVLDDLDLEVERGTNFVIMGLSGTGKSVSLKLMCGLDSADSGTIEIGDVHLENARPADIRRVRKMLGFVFQGAALINWLSARENVALPLLERGIPRREVDEIVDRELAEVGLSDIGDKYPDEISGGMRKRVGFARATVDEPKIVLYDEPTSGLDPQTTRVIDELIVDARDRLGATGVVVSHDVASALRVGDRIGLLYEGRMDVVLTPEEFRESDHPVVRSFLESAPTGASGRSS